MVPLLRSADCLTLTDGGDTLSYFVHGTGPQSTLRETIRSAVPPIALWGPIHRVAAKKNVASSCATDSSHTSARRGGIPPASLSHSLRTHSLRRNRGGSARPRRRAATASQPPGPSLVCTPQPRGWVGWITLSCKFSKKSRWCAPSHSGVHAERNAHPPSP